MVSLISEESTQIHDDKYITVLDHSGRVYERKGPWKLVQIARPYREEDFLLFKLDNDLGETTDLKPEFYGGCFVWFLKLGIFGMVNSSISVVRSL